MDIDGLAILRFALDAYPAGFGGNRLNLLMLDAEPIKDSRRYLYQVDCLTLMPERREYCLSPNREWPFPVISIDERPSPEIVSRALAERLQFACRVLPTQGQIGQRLARRARRKRPDIVALVIIDGLSYYDYPYDKDVQPCLVEGISTTRQGYLAVTGQPHISRLLFALGYTNQLAFTYYKNDTGISAEIHRSFSDSQVQRISNFEEVLERILVEPRHRMYVQVSLAGLDQICHAHHDRPPRDRYVNLIAERFDRLMDCLAADGRRVLGCLTADHGILWRDDLEGDLRIASDLLPEQVRSPRYIKGALLRPYGVTVQSLGQTFTLLKYPWMLRRFRNNEWGVHGGISAWESIVPLHMVEA